MPLRQAALHKQTPGDLSEINCWIFDLDNTLYPSRCDLFRQIDAKMGQFLADMFECPLDEARTIQKEYYRDYGSTLRGLMTRHGLEPKPFLDYVHDIDFSPLSQVPAQKHLIEQLPGRKLVFTNGDAPYAQKVLDHLGLGTSFEAIHDIVSSQFQPKPFVQGYQNLIETYEIDPTRAILFDDLARNLEPASQMGMKTVWVPGEPGKAEPWAQVDPAVAEEPYIDYVALNLPKWLAEIG